MAPIVIWRVEHRTTATGPWSTCGTSMPRHASESLPTPSSDARIDEGYELRWEHERGYHLQHACHSLDELYYHFTASDREQLRPDNFDIVALMLPSPRYVQRRHHQVLFNRAEALEVGREPI